ncbi:galactose-3-O-sulfotransferase 3-like [Mizuhopecten yessoensis]|uniref:Galactose-3-O-sulfotransferase 3 n=1 Tax=Mizuhopecten yessoensis TaxID=6573 RepID=A0A210PWB9_MIZYE|nr:galactose-3-O-sulfotransferase 3-like [Mizuhopecten yessoensis]OWF40791.1 Galactose-3-O-sulfotransferase 3 [Mizuhopecten yessoensis]
MRYSTRCRLLLLGVCAFVTLFYLRRYTNRTVDVGEKMLGNILYRINGYSSQNPYSLTGNPVNHIAFLKVRKAASTTVENIFLRYGDEKNLIFALPRHSGGGTELTSSHFYPPPKNKTYDITCAHVNYDTNSFRRVLHADTKYIGIVREPFSHFRSYIRFTHPKSVVGIPGDNPVLEYLSREEQNRNKTGHMASVCNRMAVYYGFSRDLFSKRDRRQTLKYILKLDKEMDLVLVLEFLDESIVLMRRILNWDLRHVLYGKLRVNKREDSRLKFGEIAQKLHRNCAYLDYQLYEFFVQKLKEKIKDQPPDFYDELAYFRKTRMKYEDFCLSSISNDDNNASITFEGSAWNQPFVITWEHCKKLYVHDVTYLGMLIKKQYSAEYL